MIYVIYGDEPFLLEQKLKDIKKEYHIVDEDMNMNTYDCLETSIKEIVEDCNTSPFLSEFKMVLMKNPYFLTTQKTKSVNADELALFEEYIKQPLETTVLVIYHPIKNFDERKKLIKLLKKETTYLFFDKLNHQQLKNATIKAIRSRNADIDDLALEVFLSRVPNNLNFIANEVDKLTLYTNTITIADVNLIVSKTLEENAFELVSAIMKKEQTKAISIYKDLMINNEEPIKLIVLIANQLRLLLEVKTLDRKGYNDQEIAKILSVNPYRLKYIRVDSNNYDFNDLMKLLNELSLLDVQIKKGLVDKKRGLELFLMRI